MARGVKFPLTYLLAGFTLLCAIQAEALPLGYDPYTARDSRLNSYLKSVLDPLKEHMRKGFPKFGVPVLDPLLFGNVSRSLTSDSLNATVFIQDMTISGLSNFSLHRLDAYLRNLSVVMKLVFPKVIVSSEHYQLNGSAASILPLVGDGQVSVHINEIEVTIGIKFAVPSPGKMKVDNVSLDVDYGHASVFFEDLMGGGSLGNMINGFLSSPRAKIYFAAVKPSIMNQATKLVKERANKMLSKFDLSKLEL